MGINRMHPNRDEAFCASANPKQGRSDFVFQQMVCQLRIWQMSPFSVLLSLSDFSQLPRLWRARFFTFAANCDKPIRSTGKDTLQ